VEPTDLTIEILKQIRDGVTQTNEQLDQTNERLDRVERRQSEMETRLATELVAVAGAVRELRDVLVEDRKLRDTVRDHERRIRSLEEALGDS
jgi:septal ring factor EnvC (AmiA/AmiB activator)